MAYNIWGGYNSFSSLAQESWVVESSGVDDYMEAATLGDLTSSKVRVVMERVTWSAEGYLFSQAGNSLFTREFGFYIFGGNYGIILGGSNNTNIGAVATNPTVDTTVDVTVDYIANTLLLIIDGVTVFNGAISAGTSRVDGELFRLFARGGGALAPAGTRVGNTQVYIDDVLVRNYDFDNSSHGAGTVTVNETVSSLDLTGVNMLTNGDAWVDLSVNLLLDDITTKPIVDSLDIQNIAQLAVSDVSTLPTIDNVDLLLLTELSLSGVAIQPTLDDMSVINLTELSFNNLTVQATSDLLVIDSTISLQFSDLTTQPMLDSVAVENYTNLSFNDVTVKLTLDLLSLPTDEMPDFGSKDIVLTSNAIRYFLMDNTTNYRIT